MYIHCVGMNNMNQTEQMYVNAIFKNEVFGVKCSVSNCATIVNSLHEVMCTECRSEHYRNLTKREAIGFKYNALTPAIKLGVVVKKVEDFMRN